jgi:hypothetical protein
VDSVELSWRRERRERTTRDSERHGMRRRAVGGITINNFRDTASGSQPYLEVGARLELLIYGYMWSGHTPCTVPLWVLLIAFTDTNTVDACIGRYHFFGERHCVIRLQALCLLQTVSSRGADEPSGGAIVVSRGTEVTDGRIKILGPVG